MPVPMMAPMPSSVRSHAVRLRLRERPPLSTSPTSCSIDFVWNRFESIRPPGVQLARAVPTITGRRYNQQALQTLEIIEGTRAAFHKYGGIQPPASMRDHIYQGSTQARADKYWRTRDSG